MGSSNSRRVMATSDEQYAILKYQQKLQEKNEVPLQVAVSHYTPPSFPLLPMINPSIARICEKSWDLICHNDITDENGGKISGITAFYNEFYERIDLIDPNGAIDAVLSKHSGGQNKVAAKGSILIRIVKYAISIAQDSEETQTKLLMLGKSHAKRFIKPYLYSMFIQTLLQTISSRLGTEATNQVMEAWVNLFAFIMKSMLPPAIKNDIVETDLFINTSSVFNSGKIAEEANEMEEMVKLRKNMKKGGTSVHSSELSRNRKESGEELNFGGVNRKESREEINLNNKGYSEFKSKNDSGYSLHKMDEECDSGRMIL